MMRTAAAGAVCCLAVFASVGSGFVVPLAAQVSDSRQEAGQALLDANCSRCHAVGQTGDSPHAAAPPFRAVVLKYAPADLSEALAEGIVSGHPDMPQFTFEPAEIDAIVGYLESLKAAP